MQEIGSPHRSVAIIQFRNPNRTRGVDERLLLDAPDALARAHREGVVGSVVAWTLPLEFPVGLFVRVRLLSGHARSFRPDQAFLGDLGFQRLEAFPHPLQIMPEPEAPDAR